MNQLIIKMSNKSDSMKSESVTFEESERNYGQTSSQELSFPKEQIQLLSTRDYFSCIDQYTKSFRKDDYRILLANEDGGIGCSDSEQIQKLRSVGTQVIKIIGSKILSGSFDLTKISFPIRVCIPKTALYNAVSSAFTFPHFMNRAAKTRDPVERFKISMVALLSAPYYLNMFLKPLNPILGQTLQGSLSDGTKVYAQQISHHPPISYFLIVGPNKIYTYSGYYNIEVSPGLNTLNLKNIGLRKFMFEDGGEIISSFPRSKFSGTFFGTSRCEEKDQCVFTDQKNKLTAKIQFSKVKKRPSDYFQSNILKNNQPISKIYGTYCGYIDFDGVRYWDGRDIQSYNINMQQNKLPSDWSYRPDVTDLLQGKIDQAQKSKQQLQQLQRNDAKLRLKYIK